MGGAGATVKQTKLSATIGVKTLLGGSAAILATKPLSQDWGNVVCERCWRYFEQTKTVSLKWGKVLEADWGRAVVGRCSRRSEATKPVSQD